VSIWPNQKSNFEESKPLHLQFLLDWNLQLIQK
jgi:hypothetical protein